MYNAIIDITMQSLTITPQKSSMYNNIVDNQPQKE